MAAVELTAGTIEYTDTGGDGPVVVMFGGLAINGSLWDGVVQRLRATHRCVVPTMAWGGHRIPMRPDADLTLEGHATMLGEFLERLDLHDVTLVENDSSMAQVLAARRPERVARLVLCSCEALDNYPPGMGGKMIGVVGKLPGGVNFAMQQMRVRPLRRLPVTFGQMTKHGIPDEMFDDWIEPLLTQKDVRRDLTKYIRSVDKGALMEVATRLPAFDRPALVVWASESKMMPLEHGRRLAAILPQGRLVEVEDSYTLIPLDQPERLSGHIRDFVAEAA